MHHAPPPTSSSGDLLVSAPENHLSVNWDPSSLANPPVPRIDNNPKETGGTWGDGCSAATSLTDNQDDTTLRSSLARHFRTNIDTTHTDIVLIICGFVSGLVDGLSFNAWGSFASMQTGMPLLHPRTRTSSAQATANQLPAGNSVFIALGVSGQPAYPAYLWAKSLIALTVFITSNILFIHVSRALGPRRRSTLILSFAVQTAALLAAAILVQLGVISPKPEDPRAPIEWMQILPISLLSFQAGGQIVASRVLGIDEIPTVVLTTLLCDLLVDPKLTEKVNPKRNRRAGAFLALFLGAMTAGGLSKVTEMAASLWFAFVLKFLITAGWFVWKREGRTEGKRDVEG
ncbi:unnamed protein product [Aspergillus oryzae]|uniref:Unnamed protein product n=1 Tax=Aspergillus oryzae var. brunneus TaxID=332754 RepID=A0ABQ6KG27_ASPOZ|nr:unnamed protein product [Aspergillus oryzae]GMF86292.1 unnamed protein product [Aspergillus oryzae]GMG02565.1 unnamed protein product [Aspergillus oryzae]GMG41062.1 unnamed protein product [Aspergillus oryzae var. brunneus]